MAETPPEQALTAFIDALLARDGAGGSWLGALLRAAPYGHERLGELAEQPGWLQTQLAVRGPSGQRGAFAYLTGAPRELEAWLISHPDRLAWPIGTPMSPDTERLRRALVCDEPAGARARAQDRARDLWRSRSTLSQEWWRFELPGPLACALITERLVVTVLGSVAEAVAPASDWYPGRPTLVRYLEAARRLADGKWWGTLVLSESVAGAPDESWLAARTVEAAPHLDDEGRAQLREGYLGVLSFADARAATAVTPSRR